MPKQWAWSEAKITAAALIAENALTDAAIARQVGVDKRRLSEWRDNTEFLDRVAENVATLQKEAMEYGLARKAERVARVATRLDQLEGIRLDRSRAAKLDPNSPTETHCGLFRVIVRTKTVETEKSSRTTTTTEYHLDRDLLDAERDLLRHMALEKGELTEKVQHSGGVTFEEAADAFDRRMAKVAESTVAGRLPGPADEAGQSPA